MSRTNAKYDNVTVMLHWVIGIGILVLGGIELFRHEFPKGHFIREGFKAIHQPAGTVIFALIMFRLMWRMTMAKVPTPQTIPGPSAIAAKLVHLALYALMIALPLAGMLYVFGSNKVIDFGAFSLALQLKDVIGGSAKSMREVHEALGLTIMVLGLAHAAAALAHHYLLKDDVLARMRIGRRPHVDQEPRGPIVAAQ
jgi:superoxide oxidase